MSKNLLFVLLVFLPFSNSLKAASSLPLFEWKVTKESSQVLKVNIKPLYFLPGRIYSLTLLKENAIVTFPLPKEPAQKDTESSIFVTLQETAEGTLVSPFYKKSWTGSKFENPFAKLAVTDMDGKSVGATATGILYYMARKVGPGVILTPNSQGEIKGVEDEGFSFLLHFNTKISKWKFLLCIVHIELFKPQLESPSLSQVVSIN